MKGTEVDSSLEDETQDSIQKTWILQTDFFPWQQDWFIKNLKLFNQQTSKTFV